ncbi:MAG: hypothetical protein ACLFPN_02620 [Methanomassiliicoccales archaeon]
MKRLMMIGALTLAALMVMSGLAVAQGPDDNMGQEAGPPDTDFTPGDQDLNNSEIAERMRQMAQEGVAHNMFGPMDASNGTVGGHFVQFQHDQENGDLINYSVLAGEEYLQLFDSVLVEGFQPENDSMQGSIMTQSNDSVKMIVHNNPTCMIHLGGNNTTVSFQLSNGTSAEEVEMEGDLDRSFKITNQEVAGFIGVGNGSMALDEGNHTLNVTIKEGQAFFRMTPSFAPSGPSEDQQRIEDALSQGRVAAEMSVMVRDGDSMGIGQHFQDEYRMNLVSAEPDNVSTEISSERPEGKVAIIKFDPETLNASKGLELKMDGSEVAEAESLDEVLSATGSQTEDARYFLVDGEENHQVAVYVPNFSTHALDLTTEAESGSALDGDGLPLLTVGLIAAVALVGIIAVTVYLRRK